jgi:hypothetical protein
MLWLGWKYVLWGASENQFYDKTKRCTNDTMDVLNKMKQNFNFLKFYFHLLILCYILLYLFDVFEKYLIFWK